MTWNELKKNLQYYLYEQDYQIWGRFSNRDRRLDLYSIIYLCKKCYEAGLNYEKRNLDPSQR